MLSSSHRRRVVVGALAAAITISLAACSPASSSGGDSTPSSSGSDSGEAGGGGDQTTVTFRLWDDAAAGAYETSFAEFEAANPDINVEVETIPWANYWEQLPLDLSSGEAADIFWVNTSNFGIYVDNGNLVNISETLGDDHDPWSDLVVDLYTRDGSLWGVPQLQDSIALFYNKTLLDAAGIDPTTLKWDPTGAADTLLPALQTLTVDAEGRNATDPAFDAATTAVYGLNAQNDLQAIWGPFVGSNGGTYQDGDLLALSSPENEQTFQYLVDLINTHKVAPPAADTLANGDLARDYFVQGKLALFQSGQYSLPALEEIGDSFEWAIAPPLEGPAGRVGLVHGVAAVGNADSANPEAQQKVLEWLGSTEGQLALAETGAAFPGATDAQDAYVAYWQEKGVDITALQDAANGEAIAAPVGPNINAGFGAFGPYFEEMFLGRLPVAEALQQADTAGNEAIEAG
ncbi:ABC transporter substrate-binding protein [Salana multivorans]